MSAVQAYVEQEKGKQQHETDEPNLESKEDASTTPKPPDKDAIKDGERAGLGAAKGKEQGTSPVAAEKSGAAPQDPDETDNSTSEKGSNPADSQQPKSSPRKKSKPIAKPQPAPAADVKPEEEKGTAEAAATPAASSEVADEREKAPEGNNEDPAQPDAKVGADTDSTSRSEQVRNLARG